MNGEFYIDGKKYISASRAAKLTGYAMDYIGQLARNGKIDSKMLGRSWFVSEESLLGYKREVLDLIFTAKKPKKNSAKNRRERLILKALAAAKKEAEKNNAAAASDAGVSGTGSGPELSAEKTVEALSESAGNTESLHPALLAGNAGAELSPASASLSETVRTSEALSDAGSTTNAETRAALRSVTLAELGTPRMRSEAHAHAGTASVQALPEAGAVYKKIAEILPEAQTEASALAAALAEALPMREVDVPRALEVAAADTRTPALASVVPVPLEPRLVRGNVLPAEENISKGVHALSVRSPYWNPMLAASGSMLFGMTLALMVIAIAPHIGELYDASQSGTVAVGSGVHVASREAKKILARSPLYLHAGVATVERSLAMNVSPDVAGTSPHAAVAVSSASANGSLLSRIGAAISGYLDRVSLAMLDTGSKLLGFVPRMSIQATKLSTYASSSGEVAANRAPAVSDSVADGPSQAMAVVPSSGNAAEDRKVAKYIKDSFSDDVKVVSKNDDGTGVIEPVFKSGKKDDYLYVLVPIKDGS